MAVGEGRLRQLLNTLLSTDNDTRTQAEDTGAASVQLCRPNAVALQAKVHRYLETAMMALQKAIANRDQMYTLFVKNFLQDLSEKPTLRPHLLTYTGYNEVLKEVLKADAQKRMKKSECEEEGWPQCMHSLLSIILNLVSLEIDSLKPLHSSFVDLSIRCTGVCDCLGPSLALLAKILQQYNDEEEWPEYILGFLYFEVSGLLTLPSLLEIRTGLEWLIFLEALCRFKVSRYALIHYVRVEHFEEAVFDILQHYSECGPALVRAQSAALSSCSVCVQLAVHFDEWDAALQRMLSNAQVQKMLSNCLSDENISMRRDILKLIKHPKFSGDKINLIFGGSDTQRSLCSMSSIELKSNEQQRSIGSGTLTPAMTLSLAQENAPDDLISKSNSCLDQNKKNEIPNVRVKPKILKKDRECTLSNIVTRGVVSQKTIEKTMDDVGQLDWQKDKAMKKTDKRSFSDSLMGSTKSTVVDDVAKRPKLETKSEDNKPKRNVLRSTIIDTNMATSSAASVTMKTVVRPKEEPPKDIFEDGEFTEWLKPLPLPIETFDAIPTYVDNNLDVYLHNVEAEHTLDFIKTELERRFKDSKPSPKDKYWSIGQPCIAEFVLDKSYYRAKILEVNDDVVKVQFVDYGNEETCNISKVRKAAVLCDIPIQCSRGRLLENEPKPGEFEQTHMDMLHKILVDNRVTVTVLNALESDLYFVKLIVNDFFYNSEMIKYLNIFAATTVDRMPVVKTEVKSPEQDDSEPEIIYDTSGDVKQELKDSDESEDLTWDYSEPEIIYVTSGGEKQLFVSSESEDLTWDDSEPEISYDTSGDEKQELKDSNESEDLTWDSEPEIIYDTSGDEKQELKDSDKSEDLTWDDSEPDMTKRY